MRYHIELRRSAVNPAAADTSPRRTTPVRHHHARQQSALHGPTLWCFLQRRQATLDIFCHDVAVICQRRWPTSTATLHLQLGRTQVISQSLLFLCLLNHSVSLQRIFLTQNQIVKQVNIFFSAGTLWSAATCESVDCAGVSELFQPPRLLFVHYLFGNSSINSAILYPFN